MYPEVDAYIGRVKQWQSEIQLLRSILLDCKLEETIKWGQPCYTIHDKNIVLIAPFKAHCDLGFVNGAVLKDEKQLLVAAGKHTQGARQMRFTNLKDIEVSKSIIRKYIKEAIENEKNGVKLIPTKKNEIEVMYGAGTHVKIHSISFSITNNIIVIEAIIVLGEEINESVIDRTLIDYLIQDSIPYFFSDVKSTKVLVRWDV